MKLYKEFHKIFILFLIISSQFIQISSKNNSKRKKLARTKARSFTQVWDKIKKIFSIVDTASDLLENAKKAFYLVLGIISVFFEPAKTFYNTIKDNNITQIWETIKSCYDAIKSIFIREDNKPITLNDTPIKTQWESLTTDQEKIDFCKEVQNKFKIQQTENFSKWDETWKTVKSYASGPVSAMIRTNSLAETNLALVQNNYCRVINADEREIFFQKWGGKDNYMNECEYFKEMDCENLIAIQAPSYSFVKNFIDKVKGLYEIFNACKDCISKVWEVAISFYPDLQKYYENIIGFLGSNIASTITNTVINIISLGAYGTVRTTYYLLKLGYRLWKLINVEEIDFFELGVDIGYGIKAAKSFIFGRKKKKLHK